MLFGSLWVENVGLILLCLIMFGWSLDNCILWPFTGTEMYPVIVFLQPNVKPCSMIGLCRFRRADRLSSLWPPQGQTCADYPGITKLLMEVPGLSREPSLKMFCQVQFISLQHNCQFCKSGTTWATSLFFNF